ncbi:1,4-dihydroxy-2-naphthoate octaprenyltransferase [Frondihabitans sucicola]|uniref:1,4-dihydroxy-2-naphthoate octaprenyltransferase n=1 Tax=Frondihabitans sucicola TaxID=1268041 RepID=A0ABM8GTJ4_9MICO|nr:1,4-dihydroxy-2-naphthoate polyprenyltransferase [Frondihabitans sucicola]BDZ51773.1 1,4-dihydroxy-2-naphthoate octaprenyltransferase [Frondihabitans sucicola]
MATSRTKSSRSSKKSGRPGGRPGKTPVRKATVSDWISGARPRTLTLAVAPVALGSAAASETNRFDWPLAVLCLVVALFLQIGVNYANDYSDGIRGTDKYRVGPARLTGGGVANPRIVRNVSFASFAVAAAAGIAVIVITQFWWMALVGAACVVAAWFYTGGKRPYGYNAMGEIFVFVFFGLVATLGTEFVQRHQLSEAGWIMAIMIGLFSCGVLMINNIRDIDQDRQAGKRTLAVVLGQRLSRVVYALFLGLPYVLLVYFAFLYFGAGYVYFSAILTAPAILIGVTAKTPPEMILALKLSSFSALLFSLALAAVLFFLL